MCTCAELPNVWARQEQLGGSRPSCSPPPASVSSSSLGSPLMSQLISSSFNHIKAQSRAGKGQDQGPNRVWTSDQRTFSDGFCGSNTKTSKQDPGRKWDVIVVFK